MHLRWSGVWQRPQHVLTRLARYAPVYVLEEPVAALDDAELVEYGNVTVVRPQRVSWSDTIDERAIGAVAEIAGAQRPLIWLYTPQMLALADAFPGTPLVYDKMDELARFHAADPRIAEREPEVLRRAAVAFAGGRSLYASIEGRTRRAACYPSGVDVAHFAQARRAAEHPALAGIPRPRAIYVGVIDERLDLDLIGKLARRLPSISFVMAGPVAKIDPASLPQAGNLVYLGQRAYEELPALLAGADAALMPFALNEATRYISPTKTLEYLAAGMPVVSTPVPDVVADHADIVTIAGDVDQFAGSVERAIATGRRLSPVAATRVARSTWDAVAAAMLADLAGEGIVVGHVADELPA